MINDIILPEGFLFRLIHPEDSQFLLELFRSTREHLLLMPLPRQQIELLVSQQFLLQQNSYATNYPHASNLIILFNSLPIGKIILNDVGRSMHIVDMAIIPTERNKGYGKLIIHAIQACAARKKCSVSLSVDLQNTRAKKLYLALGLRVTGSSGTHESMVWDARARLD